MLIATELLLLTNFITDFLDWSTEAKILKSQLKSWNKEEFLEILEFFKSDFVPMLLTLVGLVGLCYFVMQQE